MPNIQDAEAEKFRRASAVVRAATIMGFSGSSVEHSWDDESVVRWLVDVEVQPADEPPFAAGCDLSLLDAYSVSPGEPVTVAYHAESKRCDHIVDVEDQRRGGEPVAAAHGLRLATRRSAAEAIPRS